MKIFITLISGLWLAIICLGKQDTIKHTKVNKYGSIRYDTIVEFDEDYLDIVNKIRTKFNKQELTSNQLDSLSQ